MAEAFDPRLTPARPDLAADFLKGRIEAARYVAGEPAVVVAPQAPVRRDPVPDAMLLTEALQGEAVTVYETTDEGWCWAQLQDDGYVGWIPAEALDAPGPAPTDRVHVLRTLAFPGPSIKLPPVATLPLGARLAVDHRQGIFAVTAAGHHVPAQHLSPLAQVDDSDPVAVAERFVGTPYLWGGKTSLGLDCSGLVQVALTACGIACPRDSDMQEQALGQRLAFADLRRGDLIFWKGHVAMARDGDSLIHANAFHMAVTVESVTDAVARIEAAGSAVTSVRRLSGSD